MNCSRNSPAARSSISRVWVRSRWRSLSICSAISWANSSNIAMTRASRILCGLASIAQRLPKYSPSDSLIGTDA